MVKLLSAYIEYSTNCEYSINCDLCRNQIKHRVHLHRKLLKKLLYKRKYMIQRYWNLIQCDL